MPICRLFGLLVSVLCLLSAPALAQTVAFVDASGADASAFLEKTEARVRVTDPAAGTPSAIDTVQVTLSAALSGDSEPLTLWETDRDSGAFEGRIRLNRDAPPGRGPARPQSSTR